MDTASRITLSGSVMLILGREYLSIVAPILREQLGDGWAVGAELWSSNPRPFCVMYATHERLLAGEPVVVLCEDLEGLRLAVEEAMPQLGGGHVEVVYKVPQEAREMVEAILARDAVCVGHA